MGDKESELGSLPTPIGLGCLIHELGLSVPLPAVRSEAVAGARRTRIVDGIAFESYPKGYAPTDLIGQLKFAMRYEPLDLGIYNAVFKELDRHTLEHWVRRERTGVFARRAWYMYEFLTDKTLDVPDVPPTGYADLLDRNLHVTAAIRRVKRQRINNNLLGGRSYCPLIRRTEVLETSIGTQLAKEAKSLVESCDPGILARAVNYLYTKETKSSFAIEGETAKPDRAERFVAALADAASFDALDPQSFVRLQNAIVDPRYAEQSWRTVQNFVGQPRRDFSEQVHYVCPKPQDVPSLMHGWMEMLSRLYEAPPDAVCAAAAASFGFVFIHPFEDGNGRIHRFLIHQMLGHLGFTPPGLLFPVAAVMLRDRRAYEQVLNGYSSAVMPFIQHTIDERGHLKVHSETAELYRFWDATPFAEYLYGCVSAAIRHDLREEIGFLRVFDEAVRQTMNIVDMPDRRASLLVRLILQNNGRLSGNKREQFGELNDEEVRAIETAVRSASVQPSTEGSV